MPYSNLQSVTPLKLDEEREGGNLPETITGTEGDDLIDGYGGDDTITGLGGDDIIIGGDGNDVIDGGSGTNRLYADAGDDTITSSGTNDVVDAGEGNNSITIDGTGRFVSGSGNDNYFIDGIGINESSNYDNSGSLEIDAGGGDDNFENYAEPSYYIRPIYRTGDGDDYFLSKVSFDNNYLDTGDGNDEVLLEKGSGHIGSYPVITLGSGDDNLIIEGDNFYGNIGGGDGKDIIDLTALTGELNRGHYLWIGGGEGDDIIKSYDRSDIRGGSGNDAIEAGDVDDNVYGGDGNDSIEAGDGNNSVYGDDGNDYLESGGGADSLFGGYGDDIIKAGGGNDIIYGRNSSSGKGDDGSIDTAVFSGASTDYKLSRATDTNFDYVYYIQDKREGSPDGLDTLYDIDLLRFDDGDINIDSLYELNVGDGSDGETITGTEGDDLIDGYGGDDTITGLGGDDIIIGGDGNDVIDGGSGTNRLYADAGDDTITSSGTNDVVDAGEGNNSITIDGTGRFVSGSGNDNYFIDGIGINESSNYDNSGSLEIDAGGGDDNFENYAEPSYYIRPIYRTGDGDDYFLSKVSFDNNYLDTGDGNDEVLLEKGSGHIGSYPVITLGSGDDNLIIEGDNFYGNIGGGDGKDIIDLTALTGELNRGHYLWIGGGEGDDIIKSYDRSDIRGGSGNDAIEAGDVDDNVYGGDGNDSIEAGDGNNSVYGDDGNDYLESGGGADSLFGGYGDDIIKAGGGNDIIYGRNSSSGKGDDGSIDTAVFSGASTDYKLSRATDTNFDYVYYIQDKREGSPDGLDTLYDIDLLRFDDGDINIDSLYELNVGDGSDGETITGTEGDDLIDGYGGDDTITGLGGDDIIIGGDGNDVIDGGSGTNRLYADAGDDTITSSGTNDVVDAGEGNNSITIDGTGRFVSGSGNDNYFIDGIGINESSNYDNSGSLEIDAGGGDDNFENYAEPSYYIRPIYRTGDGDDYFLSKVSFDNNYLDTGDGNDEVLLEKGSGHIGSYPVITLGSGDDNLIIEGDNFYGNIGGGDGKDIIDLTALTGELNRGHYLWIGGGEGDDIIKSYDRSDIRGGSGNDAIEAGDVDDNVYGGDGNDSIEAGDGNNSVYGDDGNDYLESGGGADSLFGGYGDDIIKAGGGNDIIYGRNSSSGKGDDGSIDTAVFSGASTDYKLSRATDTNFDYVYYIQDKREGSPDGLDTLYDIDLLRFDDGDFDLNDYLLISSNQRPTGTPLLTGDFIPGETIFADLSGVSDPDNPEGFRPEYSYQWEVSSDGENWEIKENTGTSNNINIYVSGGNLSEPFYEFYLDAAGNNKLSNLTLDAKNSYTFRRLNGQTSHPFYISDSGIGNNSSSSIAISGDGGATSGIKGNESFTLSFNNDQQEIHDLTFYCTSHSNMQANFDIHNWDLETVSPDSYLITAEDEGKQIRAHISYFDGKGKEESVTTDAFDIATRIDLSDENIRRFDPGSVSNINLIDFSTLDEKFYRRFDWEEVNYRQLNILAKDDIAWDKVVFRKATRSDNFTIDAVDWDEVNDSKYVKSIYRTIDWDDVDYASMSDQLKEDLDWSQVQLKEAKRSDDFSIDIVNWNEVNESKYAKSIYRVFDWDDVDYASMSDQLKEDLDWSKVQLKEAKRSNDFSIDIMDWDEINASKTAKGIYRNLNSDDFIDIDANTLLKLEESGLLSRKLKESIRPFINESIVGGTESEPLLDVIDLDFNDVKLDVNFSSDSDKSLNFGIYVIENLDGAVKDPITGELITPGSMGYEEAALDENNIYFELALNKGDDLTDTFEATEGIDLFAPFMEDQLTGEVYFAFDEANSDGDLFFKSNGDGTIGVKDDKNNDDFDDLIVSLDLHSF